MLFNKHKFFKITLSIVVIIIAISIPLFRIILRHLQTTTYTIPPKTCVALFGETPKEFAKNPNDWDTWEDFCVDSKVNNAGNLELKLSDKQKATWKNFYESHLQDAKKLEGIYISDDYTKMSVALTSKTALEQTSASIMAFKGCFVNQLLNGKDPETMFIDITFTDAETGSTIAHANWPDEEIDTQYVFEMIQTHID